MSWFLLTMLVLQSLLVRKLRKALRTEQEYRAQLLKILEPREAEKSTLPRSAKLVDFRRDL